MKRIPFFLFVTFWLGLARFWAIAQPEPISSSVTLPDHPRLLLLAGEEQSIRRNIEANKTWSSLHQAILSECDNLITVAPVERIQIGRRLLDKSREAIRRIFYLSYAWRLTNDVKYRQRAEKELLAISAFSDWNPSHFLDVAEMTLAAAIGYDWLYKDLSPESRSIIREAILKKGIEPSQDPKYNGFLKVTNNWNQVCNAGIAYGAMAIYENQPELARKMINRAIETVVIPMKEYAPDGAYPEGYSYWGYGTSFNVLLISALEKAFGSDFGLSQQPGFLKSAAYMNHMTGTSGLPFNYSDAGKNSSFQPAIFWFAGKTKDPSLLWTEQAKLQNGGAKKVVDDRLLPATLVWGSGTTLNDLSAPKATMWVGNGTNPVAMLRSSWTNPNAVYVGFKAGSPSASHAHMDIGSFVMDADGVRWAMDFGMQDYNSLESKGVQLWGREQNAQRWQVYRYNNFVHNTLTVNNALQQVGGSAPLISHSTSPSFMNAVTDLTTVYKGSLAKAQRGIALVDKAYVVVRDELETLPGEASVRWTMLTPANVTITAPNRAELSQNGKKLIVEVVEPAGAALKTWSTTPPHDYDAPNTGTQLLGFDTALPGNTKAAITVRLVPERAAGKAGQKVTALTQWPK